MTKIQKITWNLFRCIFNPYFKKYPGAMLPVLFGFERELHRAGFTREEIEKHRKEFENQFRA